MGNESSQAQMDKTLWNMKFTSKQMAAESRKCEKKQREEESKCLKAQAAGTTDIAKVYASNAIREKTQALNLLRMAARIEAVSARVESAIRMKQLTSSITSVTIGMDSILASMDCEKIANVMDKFESQFDTLDVRSGHMEKSLATATSTAVPEDEVDLLMQQVRERAAIDKGGIIPQAGSSALGGPAATAAGADKRAVEAGPAMPPPGDSKPDDKGGPAGGAGAGGGGGGGSAGLSLADRLAALRR